MSLTKDHFTEILGTNFRFRTGTPAGLKDLDALRIDFTYSFTIVNADGTETVLNNSAKPISLYTTLVDKYIKLHYNYVENPSLVNIENYLQPIQIVEDSGIDQMLTRLNDIVNYIYSTYKDTALDFEFNFTL